MAEEKVPEEISLEEFWNLSEEQPETARGKIDEEELLSYLSNTAATTSKLAEKFGVSYSGMHAKLTRLLNKGKVVRRYKGKTPYWTAA